MAPEIKQTAQPLKAQKQTAQPLSAQKQAAQQLRPQMTKTKIH